MTTENSINARLYSGKDIGPSKFARLYSPDETELFRRLGYPEGRAMGIEGDPIEIAEAVIKVLERVEKAEREIAHLLDVLAHPMLTVPAIPRPRSQDGKNDGGGQGMNTTTKDEVLRIVSAMATTKGEDGKIRLEDELAHDLGMGSLEQVELQIELEDFFGIEIIDGDAQMAKTVHDIVILVDRLVNTRMIKAMATQKGSSAPRKGPAN